MRALLFVLGALCLAPVMVVVAAVSQLSAQTNGVASPDLVVPHIAPAALVAAKARRESLLLFDVRGSDEYAVSRLPGAQRIQVATEDDRLRFLARLGRISGATIVFYCTTDARSTDFAQSVLHELLERGAKAVLVLQGGVIAWHNAGRPLVDSRGATRQVHPFNDEMKQHLRRPELAGMYHNNVRRRKQ